MSDQPLVPCLWLADQAEAAARFYTETFPGGRILTTARYPESMDNPGGMPRGSVLLVDFEIAGQRFTGLNGGAAFRPNVSLSFFVHVDRPAEVDRLCAALSEGGQVHMPVDSYPWSERYAWVEDRHGVSWQLLAGGEAFAGGARIVPCLMFAGAVGGKAEQAIEMYVKAFPNSRIEHLERYAEGEGPQNMVKHGRFVLDGQAMVAMDSHIDHGVSFDEGVSLQVMCDGQAEVDRYWDALAAGGGKPGPCGWVEDRFGVRWQVVPRGMDAYMASDDRAGSERAFGAVMQMGKLDVAAIEAAYRGG